MDNPRIERVILGLKNNPDQSFNPRIDIYNPDYIFFNPDFLNFEKVIRQSVLSRIIRRIGGLVIHGSHLQRKDAKKMFQSLNRIEIEVSDLRKLFEISGVGDITTDNDFINVNFICIFFCNQIYLNIDIFVIFRNLQLEICF